MATMRFLVSAAAVCIGAFAFPDEPTVPWNRNTITAEETREGGVFENINNDIVDLVSLARNDEDNPYRLPTTTKPQHYDVLWQIDMTTLSLVGSVDIQLYATQANVNEIVIHADAMNIRSLYLIQGTTTVQPLYTLDSTYQFLRVQYQLDYNEANPVIYTLSIEFDSELRNDMYGIYRSWYRNSYNDATVSWMASTQFQATAARYAFPCYDEPSFKATFNIIIRRPTNFRSWSCTRIRETRASTVANYQEDVYEITPIMSTYLLALIVAEYETLALYENNLLMYEVIGRPGAINVGQGDYAYRVGMELLAEMSNHTALDFYTVHEHIKMTQASIPDFSAGAMENWGLLTYREAYLLYDENHTDDYYKQLIAYILSHEIAHMWFGNLVTCDWWDVLWLNEGFARYYQYFLTHWVEDYMGLETRFINEQVHTSLLSDSANNPHPLSTSGIGSPAQVSGMFSTLTYNKGAAIIRQTEHLLGFDVHRQGLRTYLSTKSFDTAHPIDLFQNLENAAVANGAISAYGSEFNFVDYYRSWTEQPGHPVLNVQVNHQTGIMTISQRRFNINTGYSANNLNYIVALTFATASNPDFENTKPTHIIYDSITNINRGSVGDEWVILNKQQTGFYRVNYDDYTWDLIALALRGPQRTLIHEYNRAQIVDDVFQFARSGLMTYNRALNILAFLEEETEYTPWLAAITGFNWVRNRLLGTNIAATFEAQFSVWAARVMEELTYYPIAGESYMRGYLRLQLTNTLCAYGNAACRAAAWTQFRNLIDNGVEVPVNSRVYVYCNGLRQGTEADFNVMYTRFLQHNTETEKNVLLRTLGCAPHAASINRFLTDILEDNYIIRPQDYTTAYNSAVTGNEGNTQIVFQYIQNNLNTVSNAFDNIATPLSYVSSRLRTQEEITAFQTWVDQNAEFLGNSYNAVYSGVDNSVFNLEWSAQYSPDLSSFLVNGPETIQATTAAPVVVTTPVTVTSGPLLELSTPSFPDSAASTFLSVAVLALAAIVNILM